MLQQGDMPGGLPGGAQLSTSHAVAMGQAPEKGRGAWDGAKSQEASTALVTGVMDKRPWQ